MTIQYSIPKDNILYIKITMKKFPTNNEIFLYKNPALKLIFKGIFIEKENNSRQEHITDSKK